MSWGEIWAWVRSPKSALAVIIVTLAVFALGGTIARKGLWSAETASWVQGLGAIAAIYASVAVARRQVVSTLEQAEDSRRRSEADARVMIAGLLSAARTRVDEVDLSMQEGARSISRCRLWAATLRVEARALGKVDCSVLKDSRLITAFNSVATQLDYAVVCLEDVISSAEGRFEGLHGPSRVDPRRWEDLQKRIAARRRNIEDRISDFTNVLYPPVGASGPKTVVPSPNDDRDLRDL